MMEDDILVIESEDEELDESQLQQYTELRIVGRDLVSFDVTRFGSFVKRIDLSFNFLKSLHGLSVCCGTLEELVLDNNQLERLDMGAVFPRLETISLNKNRIWHISTLLKELETYAATNLRFLSLLGNPACPDQLTSDNVDESEYPKYRCHILHHLPTLRFLDHRPVTLSELTEAKKPSYANVKLSSTYTPLPASTSTRLPARTPPQVQVVIPPSGSGSPTGAVTPVIVKTRPSSASKSSKQGKRLIKYIGKNSEGNRFIKDTDL